KGGYAFDAVLGHECFCAGGIEIPCQSLRAVNAAPAIALCLHQFCARFYARYLEHCADLIAFIFGMLIVGIARTQVESFKKSAQIYTGAKVSADLFQTDGDRCFAMLVMPAFFFVIVVMRVHRAG